MENEADEIQEMPVVVEQTRWWVVSALLHGFAIALATVMAVVVEIPNDDKPLVLMTDLSERERKSDAAYVIAEETHVLAPKEEPLDSPVLVSASSEQIEEITNVDVENVSPASQGNESADIAEDSRFDPRTFGEQGLSNPLESTEALLGTGAGLRGPWEATQFIGGTTGPGIRNAFPTRTAPMHTIRCHWRRSLCHCDHSIEASSLTWLKQHQEADGSWDARKHGASVKTDTAVTGLALLAMLGAGHTEKVGAYKECVRKAVAWLKSKQDAEGMIWDTSDDAAQHRAKGYPCAIASLALIEAGGMANIPETRAAAQKAVDYICNVHQSSEGGWRYRPGSSGDLSVSGWYVMALKSAKICGFTYPPKSLENAIDFLNRMEVKEPAQGNEPAYSRYKYMADAEHAESSHRLAAIGAVMRQFTGATAAEVAPTVAWFVKKGGSPTYGTNGDKVDLYYWYYGTLAVYLQSGSGTEQWKQWSSAMVQALTQSQCKLGDDHGSWDPVGPYSSEWGRVGQTALSTLCLETWYRYQQLAP